MARIVLPLCWGRRRRWLGGDVLEGIAQRLPLLDARHVSLDQALQHRRRNRQLAAEMRNLRLAAERIDRFVGGALLLRPAKQLLPLEQ